ncbi:hypothetical protein PCL_08424 [Purpureocillium lilacinum]|uniref:Uncharacterized protein n=1 Tax=Purpureocillium lilacinum TaxID=33203 RepID=A0A2U3DRU2_PURLI|nr:hypothetical protein PCL_08424 [Purpureocillium lilacinum]
MKGTTSLIRRRTVPVKPAKLPATTAGPSLADFRSPFTWFTKPGGVTGRVFRGPASRRTLPPSPLVAAPKDLTSPWWLRKEWTDGHCPMARYSGLCTTAIATSSYLLRAPQDLWGFRSTVVPELRSAAPEAVDRPAPSTSARVQSFDEPQAGCNYLGRATMLGEDLSTTFHWSSNCGICGADPTVDPTVAQHRPGTWRGSNENENVGEPLLDPSSAPDWDCTRWPALRGIGLPWPADRLVLAAADAAGPRVQRKIRTRFAFRCHGFSPPLNRGLQWSWALFEENTLRHPSNRRESYSACPPAQRFPSTQRFPFHATLSLPRNAFPSTQRFPAQEKRSKIMAGNGATPGERRPSEETAAPEPTEFRRCDRGTHLRSASRGPDSMSAHLKPHAEVDHELLLSSAHEKCYTAAPGTSLLEDLQSIKDYRRRALNETDQPYFELECLMRDGQWYWIAESAVQHSVPSAVGTFWGCGPEDWVAPETGRETDREVWKRPLATDDDGVPDSFLIVGRKPCPNGHIGFLMQRVGYRGTRPIWHDAKRARAWKQEHDRYRSYQSGHTDLYKSRDGGSHLVALVGHRLNGQSGPRKGIQFSCQWTSGTETWEDEDKIQKDFNAAVLTYWQSDLKARRACKVPDRPLRILDHERHRSKLFLKVQMVAGGQIAAEVPRGNKDVSERPRPVFGVESPSLTVNNRMLE